jgi:carboxymethylenebutenolidase
MGEMIEFARPDGQMAPGYLAQPHAHGGTPGVVLFEEWWGVNDQIKETADRLASAGFRVLVPDVYRGRSAATGDEANHLMQGLDFKDAATQDASGAAAYLEKLGAKKVGVMGFCMGGALAMLAAMYVSEFDAAVVFYGLPPAEAGDPASITIPLQAHWALHDEHIPIAGVDGAESKLKAAGRPFESFRYDAGHAFYNPGGIGNYDREAAEAAWSRAVEFLKRTLG